MTSRHTRRNAQGPLHTLINEELARLEQTNRQQPRPINTEVGDHGNQDDIAAAMALMQKQMQQTMNARKQAAQAAAELAVQRQQQQGLDSSSNGDIMTQTTEGDFALIENKAASSANKNAETDRSMKVSSVGTSRMDELSAKMDQLIMSNQNTVFIMEDSLLEQSIKDVALDTDKPIEDQQNVVRPPTEPDPVRDYTPKVPYPVPAKATRKNQEEMKCKKMLKDLTVKLPLIDAIQMMPSMRSLMKGLIPGKISKNSDFMIVLKECCAVLQNKTEYGTDGRISKSGGARGK
ncbi:hypothetical protein DY000_02020793 [Brassica cretica]|uniref:Uncharacterized protein n=1 Tax=Brassica cretica TaxID=69181 RepID=A0ABQ7E6I5_BRACR|nr:hypothetical protein DY000_02020793 [Brassica cretica]